MFHATYVGNLLTNVTANIKAGPSGDTVYPVNLQCGYPQSIPDNSANSIQILWNGVWTPYMPAVYVPTVVPGTDGAISINWSSDNQVVILMDQETSS